MIGKNTYFNKETFQDCLCTFILIVFKINQKRDMDKTYSRLNAFIWLALASYGLDMDANMDTYITSKLKPKIEISQFSYR